jgi:YspA, cpYpsA-related SLOG family
MKVLVCGGRNYGDAVTVARVLDELREGVGGISHVIHGGATGADALAHEWALAHGVQTVECEALWDFHGDAAGPIRNRRMLELEPDLVVAFPGKKGTANLVELARKRFFLVREIP